MEEVKDCCRTPGEEASGDGCGCERRRVRTPEEQKDLVHRLNRVEGQIRGIRGMLEKDAYCIDILAQVQAAGSALNSFAKELMASHLRTCVAEDIREGSEEKLEEAVRTLAKLMR